MEKKILTIMAVLIVVAAIVVAFVMVAAGGVRTAGGFTRLFNELENNSSDTYDQYLSLPSEWNEQDSKTVSDTIVDIVPLREDVIGGIVTYTVRLYFVYIDDQWADPESGTYFHVPSTEDGNNRYFDVNHGIFHVDVSSPDNIAADYSIGDVITLKTVLEVNDDNAGELSFGSWITG